MKKVFGTGTLLTAILAGALTLAAAPPIPVTGFTDPGAPYRMRA